MPDRPTIRDARPHDAAPLAALYSTAIRDGNIMADGAPKQEAEVRRWLEALGPREACLVLEHDGEVIGWGVVVRYSDRAGYRFCGETFVYIRRDRRRRGYGAQLQQRLVERCRAYQYHHLLARIWAGNTASRTFHARHGYDVVGMQRGIGVFAGHRHDLVVMQRVLGKERPENATEEAS